VKRSVESRLASEILSRRGVSEHPSRFNRERSAFRIRSREFAHIEDGRLDLRLTRKEIVARRQTLKSDARVELRGGDWLTIEVSTQRDVSFALTLVDAAIAANRNAG